MAIRGDAAAVYLHMENQHADANQDTLLLVDDDAAYVRVLSRAMARAGFAVWPAKTLDEAKAAIVAIKPDFALVDLHLKDASGFDALAYIREHSPETRAVLVSGYATPGAAVQAMKLGAEDCLAKPVGVDVLLQSLRGADAAAVQLPDDTEAPSEVQLQHVLVHWEKNNRNTMQTARILGMHRRTLQRILKRAGITKSEHRRKECTSHFGRLRRLYRVWSRSLRSKTAAYRSGG